MSEDYRRDDELVERMLEVLRVEDQEMPPDLPDKALRKVRALITSRDLIDLATIVFVLRFCAPILDLIAAMLGQEPRSKHRRPNHE